MSKIFICFFSICLALSAYGQNNVGINTPNPDPSAVLDLTSTTQGLLVPRTKVALVATPVRGLLIFDIDTNCYVLYTGSSWRNLCVSNQTPPHLTYNDTIYFALDGSIIVTDSNGNHFVKSTQAAWLTSGNAGTTAGTNFAGTTDAQDFVLKSNNNEVIRATQNGAVGINQPSPNATALLDMQSTTRGVLFPALTTTQRDAIVGPAVGLTIYNTNLNVHQFWNGSCWANVGQTVCSFDYAISQSHSSDCLFKSNFGSVADTITVSLVSGTASPVILSAAGVPAGVLVNFSNNYIIPTQTSIMTMTALPSAANGTYTITILAASGSTIRSLTYTLTVFDFQVTLTPPSSSISLTAAQAGGIIASSTVSIGNPSTCAVVAGNAVLTYSITPSNPGLSVSFANPNPAVPGSTTMDISSSCALQGTYQITVVSVVGVSTSSFVYTLTINGPTAIHISANAYNLNLFTLAGQPSCPVVDTFIVDAGVTVGSNQVNASTGIPVTSMVTGNFTAGSQIVIINKGTIAGRGGDGGDKVNYGYFASCTGVGDGHQGGDALDINTTGVKIINQGTIGGGGGGGGAGSDLSITLCTTSVRPGAGGGGGAGVDGGSGGSGGGGSYPANSGSPGGPLLGGAGGGTTQQGPCTFSFGNSFHNGAGGYGGNLGIAGFGGGSSNGIGAAGVCPAGAGGAPGCGVKANGFSYNYSGPAPIGTNATCP